MTHNVHLEQRSREKKRKSGEQRRDKHASRIADVLEQFDVRAIPSDCSDGIMCVVIVHHGEPDPDARGAVEATDDDAEEPEWEESLLYEGRQIQHASAQVETLDPAKHDRATALAVMRTAQDVDTWL